MGKTCRQRRAPLFFQNIQADAALGIHVRVVHLGFEVHFRGLERVVGGELFVLGGGRWGWSTPKIVIMSGGQGGGWGGGRVGKN